MTSVSKQDLDQEHGEIQNLGSPILSKIQQAFLYIRTLANGTAHENFSSYRSIEGNRCGAVHIAWDKEQARLVLFVKILDFDMIDMIKEGKLKAPSWLAHLASSAQVEVTCLSFLESVTSPQDGSPGLKAVIDDMTGGVTPRRIVCVGFCIGGSVATLAAPWVAVQWPTADVRCISFGASAVGNAPFTTAFKWLVGISYRVMFRRDPVPAQSAVPNSLKHVHGAIYICGEGMRPGDQPNHHLGKGDQGDIGDHSPSAYMGALNTNCERQAAREKAAGGACRAKLGQCILKCPMERCKQSRAARSASLAASEAAGLAAAGDAAVAAAESPRAESPHAEPAAVEGMLERPQLSMRESVSSMSDSQEGDMDEIHQQPTGLTAYMRAGMGSIIADSASVSKAAIASAASVFKRRPDPKSSQRTSPSQHTASSLLKHKAPTVPQSDFDLQYMGPAKYAEVQQMLKKRWPGYVPAVNTDRTPDNSQDNCRSSMCALAQYGDSIMLGQAPPQEYMSSAASAVPVSASSNDPESVGVCAKMVTTSDYCQTVPEHEVARSKFESVLVQRGLASPDSTEYQQSLPQLMGMYPDSPEVRLARQSQSASEPQLSSHSEPSTASAAGSSGQEAGASLNAEPSTAGAAGSSGQEAGASSNAEPSTAGAAGSSGQEAGASSKAEPSTAGTADCNELGEQWAGSQPPAQMAASALAAAAENAAVAQQPGVSSLQRVEEASDTLDAEATGASLDADEASAQQYARKLTRTFSLQERDSSAVDQKELSNLQKVLVNGKISQAAILAAAAYRNHETFRRQTGITNCRLIYDREHHDTKVHVGWLEGGTAVFAFRGTASRQDGLQDVKIFSRNIDYLQELYPGVKAHLGFLQQFAAVCHPERSETNMAAVLRELSGDHTPTRVICTGHSLGGALATLGAAWAALEYPDADIRCITFGSPRVANKVFGKAFNALVGTSLRLVHGFDPIPSLPPSLMYKHVPGVIHIKRDDLLLKHRPWHTMLRSCVSDHGMMKYSKGIYKHMPGGLDSLPSFFAPKPVAKLCQSVCKRGRKASQDTDTDASVPGQQSLQPQKGTRQPNHVWAGSFVACWGTNDLDESPTSATITDEKTGTEITNTARQQKEA